MRRFSLALILFVGAPLAVSLCSAASITYAVNLAVGSGSITGDIVTDGSLGVLNSSELLDWHLSLSDGTTTFDLLGPPSGGNTSSYGASGSALTATATQLLFDFSDTERSYTIFQYISPTGSQNGYVYACFATTTNCVQGHAAGVYVFVEPFHPGSAINNDPNIQIASLSGNSVIGAVASSSTPEPSTVALLSAGIGLLGVRRACTGKRSRKSTAG